VVMGQTSVSVPSAPPTTGGAVLEEVASTEGSAPLGANAGLSRALVCASGGLHAWKGPALWWADRQNPGATLFTLDATAEGKDWERVEMGVELAVHALNTALGGCTTSSTQLARYDLFVLPSLISSFLVLLTCVARSPSCLIVTRSPSFSASKKMPGTALPNRRRCTGG
jgi:hypothetical protein